MQPLFSMFMVLVLICYNNFLFSPWCNSPPIGPGPPHYRGFTITLRHVTVSRASLNEWSALRRDLYLTTHNTHKRQMSVPSAGFERP